MHNNPIVSHRTGFMDILIPVACFHGLIVNISPGDAFGQYTQLACALFSIVFFIERGVSFRSVSKIVWGVFFLFISMSISTYLVRVENILGHEKLSSPFTPVLLSCQLLSFLGLVLYTRKTNGWYNTFVSLFYISTIYIAIMSAYAISIGPNDDPDRYFLFQNKFDLSYLLVFWLALYRTLHPQWSLSNILMFTSLSLFSLFITIWIDCSTGVLCVFFVWVCIILERMFAFFLNKKSVLLFSLPIIDISFFLFYSIVLAIPSVKFFIDNILSKESSLTGRIYIYEALNSIIMNRPFLGVGPRNGTAAMRYFLNLPNAQNGLLYIYLEIGLIGVFFFFYTYLTLIRNIKIGHENYGLLVFLYGMILASTVEINIGVNFLCYSFLLLIPIRELFNVK